MTDFFLLLGQPRLPWLEPEALKAAFLARSAELHPDRIHATEGADRPDAARRYAAMNEAYQILRETRERLRHLLELETGGQPRDIQRIPPGTMELFTEIGQACRDADAFLGTAAATVTSPMLRVRRMQAALEWSDRLMDLQKVVHERTGSLETALKALNESWLEAPPPGDPARKTRLPLETLEERYRSASYLSRWSSQLQERISALAAL